jgi:hypothetical protein
MYIDRHINLPTMPQDLQSHIVQKVPYTVLHSRSNPVQTRADLSDVTIAEAQRAQNLLGKQHIGS